MLHHSLLVQWALLLATVSSSIVADERVFVPTMEEQRFLKEGVERAKQLEEKYSTLAMVGITEHYYSHPTEGQQYLVDRFRFLRRGHKYCLLEVNKTNPDATQQKAVYHAVRLITPKANYQFVAEGQNDAAFFSLGEKDKIDNPVQLGEFIDYLVHNNWETGSAPFGLSSDLACPFDLTIAQAASPERGGYINAIQESVVDGERVIRLKMRYYYRAKEEANGEVSFFPEHYWAVKDSTIEGVNGNTGKVFRVYKTRNEYDFNGDFPKLKKATVETWDADEKKLLQSEVSTISNIDFSTPDISLFDTSQFPLAEHQLFQLSPRPIAWWRIAFFVVGLLLIVVGLFLRFKKPKEQS